MHCPSCHQSMEVIAFRNHLDLPLEIDVCWPCHLIWFDNLESAALSPGSVIEMFKLIHQKRDVSRGIVALRTNCPICTTSLNPVSDLARGGRFSYSRCSAGHGRLIGFAQFLREKNFVRTLRPDEVSKLKLEVKQIRCSSCGGPIHLETDQACTHCGAAISVLDHEAVEKALANYQQSEIRRNTRDPARMGDALIAAERSAARARRMNARADYFPVAQTDTLSEAMGDLVVSGVGAMLDAWFD